MVYWGGVYNTREESFQCLYMNTNAAAVESLLKSLFVFLKQT